VFSVPPVSPTVARWELGLRLRRRREQIGMEVKEITSALGFSRNYWSAVENDRKILSEESLTRLAELFEFDEDERRELSELRAVARQRGWWTSYSWLDPDLERFFGLEYGASTVRTYENIIVPGLLQTPAYARALMTTGLFFPQVEIAQRVEARMRRRERLEGDDPLRLTAVFSEAALRQQVGGPAVLREQLEHLAAQIEAHPNTIEVRVVPFTATQSDMFGASTLYLIDFDNPRLPTLAWYEAVSTWGVIEDASIVRGISMTFVDTLGRTLSRVDSLMLIRRCAEELA
jgi:transcriptional regulator with XRE-family HTH domain